MSRSVAVSDNNEDDCRFNSLSDDGKEAIVTRKKVNAVTEQHRPIKVNLRTSDVKHSLRMMTSKPY